MAQVQRQLRSRSIKNFLRSFIVPRFGAYQICSVRAMWSGDDLDSAENEIWAKRQQLEKILREEKRVVAFFSCITYLPESPASKKKSKSKRSRFQEATRDTSEESEDSDADRESWRLGISFWVAFDSPEMSLSTFENDLNRQFMCAGLHLTESKAIRPRGSNADVDEKSARALYTALKDHCCAKAAEVIRKSYQYAIRHFAEDNGFEIWGNVAVREGAAYSVKPVQLVLTERLRNDVRNEIMVALRQLNWIDLDIKVINIPSAGPEDATSLTPSPRNKPKSAIMKAIDVVRRHMQAGKFAIHEGLVYRKLEESKFTYIYTSSVKNYLLSQLGDNAVADVIAPYLPKVAGMLSEPTCGAVEPLKIDYNYIEALPPGTCFDIAGKCFVKDPPNLKGSPRAFVKYKYTGEVPSPQHFIKAVENSFPDPMTRRLFYQKYYQLLACDKFPMKEKKLLLLGPPNSGKTSWFCPFEGILPQYAIAGVVRDGRFSGHLIIDRTQIIFMDEWTSDSLCCEDAKRILQGGLVMLPQKHREARKVNLRCGVFATANVKPDFGAGPDADAIDARLCVMETKALKEKDTSVTGWLRKHCMQVFHFLADNLKEVPLFECSVADQETDEGAVYNDFDFDSTSLLYVSQNLPSTSRNQDLPRNNYDLGNSVVTIDIEEDSEGAQQQEAPDTHNENSAADMQPAFKRRRFVVSEDDDGDWNQDEEIHSNGLGTETKNTQNVPDGIIENTNTGH